ncbi:MAG: GNAT family N-acetyltransferase [Gammaproteobacteria bacterium]|nr:GNAT family N-acetyltransferase [Gammaproteobacteria bacterium]
MQLLTSRLIIRSFKTEDSSEYADVVGDTEVMRFLGGPVDSIAAWKYVAECIERDQATGISRYAVTSKAGSAFIGFCGFKALTEDYGQQVSPGTPWVDFGWRYRKSAWRQGFGMEAASAVYHYGKTELGLTNVEARTHRDNLGSLHIIEKLGFVWLNDYETSVGTFRRHREPDSGHQ